jgi:hypothetical protein
MYLYLSSEEYEHMEFVSNIIVMQTVMDWYIAILAEV